MTPTKTSPNGLAKITGYEGKLKKLGDGRYIAYRCPANVPTIYIGCTHGVHDGMIVTEEEGMAMFAAELEKKEAAVLRLVTVPLNQNEFDALVSFTYNCGEGAFASSSLLRKLNKGDRIGAAKAFAPWNKAKVNGKLQKLNGLVQRRASEANLFMKPVAEPEQPYMPQAVAKSAEPLPGPAVATGTAATGGVLLTIWNTIGDKFNSFFDGLDEEKATMLLGTAQKHGVSGSFVNILLIAGLGVGVYVLLGHVAPKLLGEADMTFIAPLVAWFGTIAGRLALGGGIVATIFGWLLIHDHRIRKDATNATIASIERASNEAAQKAEKARRSVDSIPDSRLRDRWFRD